MNILVIVGIGALILVGAYLTYGAFVSKKLFNLDDKNESSAKSCTLTTKHKIESRFWPEPPRQSTPKIKQKRILFRCG